MFHHLVSSILKGEGVGGVLWKNNVYSNKSKDFTMKADRVIFCTPRDFRVTNLSVFTIKCYPYKIINSLID